MGLVQIVCNYWNWSYVNKFNTNLLKHDWETSEKLKHDRLTELRIDWQTNGEQTDDDLKQTCATMDT